MVEIKANSSRPELTSRWLIESFKLTTSGSQTP